MVEILDLSVTERVNEMVSHGEDCFSLWLVETHMAHKKMMQHLVQDSPG